MTSFDGYQRALARLHIGERATVDIRRGSEVTRIVVPLQGYLRPRVRFLEAPDAPPEARARRLAWLAGH